MNKIKKTDFSLPLNSDFTESELMRFFHVLFSQFKEPVFIFSQNQLVFSNRSAEVYEEMMLSGDRQEYALSENMMEISGHLYRVKIFCSVDSIIDELQMLRAEFFEKEQALREVHHRIRNNLQIIMSFLDMKIMKEPQNYSALYLEAISSIHSIAMIHAQLSVRNRTNINMNKYFDKLVEYLSRIYQSSVRFELNCEECNLIPDQAAALAFALNEIISNSMKYAFSDKKSKEIQISLTKREKQVILSVWDNGPGFPDGFDPVKSGGLGFKIMRNLVEKQLHGIIAVGYKKGAVVKISFLPKH